MAKIKALVLRAAGINCDLETEHALQLAGSETQRLHINRIIENPACLDEFQILVFPGGFSYGDDVAAGRILANQIVHHLAKSLEKFVDDGKLILGICNGFQVLVKAGLLPGKGFKKGSVTITYNDSGKFEDRWVYLQPATEKCVFLNNERIHLPIAHGEGKVVTTDKETLDKLESEGNVAFRYVDAEGNQGGFPVNPNGSMNSIAGLTDSTGRIFGLMPHPERFVRPVQHPNWSRFKEKPAADGMTIFNNAVKFVKENL